MLKNIKKHIKLSYNDYLFRFFVGLGLYVVGVILVCVLLHFDTEPANEQTYAPMGTLFFVMFGAILSAMVMMFGFASSFSLSLSMTCTRKAFFTSSLLVEFLYNILFSVLAILLYFFEKFLYGLLYPGIPNEWNIEKLLPISPIWLVLTAALLISSLCLFLGSGYYRFGNKFMMIFWAIWIFCFCILPGLGRHSDSVLGKFIKHLTDLLIPKSFRFTHGMMLILGLSAVMTIVSYVFVRRQDLHN